MIAEKFQPVLEQRRDVTGAGVDVATAPLVARLDEDGRHRPLDVLDGRHPRRLPAQLETGKRLAVGPFEADLNAAVLEAGLLRIDLAACREVLDAHAEGEVDDGDGGPRVHPVLPRIGAAPAAGGELEARGDATL